MKIFSIALISVLVISAAFVAPSNYKAATPINEDDSYSGSYVYHNLCTNEDVDVTFTSDFSIRGTINGQKIIFKVHYNEQQQGVGRTTGARYVGHVNQSDNQSGSLTNGRYLYSQNMSARLVSQGNGNNFKSNITVRYSLNSDGEASSSREQLTSDCQ